MVDFLYISPETMKNGTVNIQPEFKVTKVSDLMIRGSDFYAVWLENEGRWSTDEGDVIRLVDKEIDNYIAEHKELLMNKAVKPKYMWKASTGSIDRWHKYCKQQMRDTYKILDQKIIFSDDPISKTDYATKRLSYTLQEGSINSYNQLMSVLYSDTERKKLEWAIGSIVNGDSRKLQKFVVLYGSAGTGKSTVLNIIKQLFDGYCASFDAKSIGSANKSFALEPFKAHPLVAIQHDGDLSRIEDNTRLNSLVSHETMTMEEKFKSAYEARFKTFLFMGTNKPVKITDAKSGLIRRLIDVSPTGNTIPAKQYRELIDQIKFELGAIAWHCKQVYESDPAAYDGYIPVSMLGASNSFYNFICDSYYVLKKEDPIPLKQVWDMYKSYCSEANVPYPFSQMQFKEELKNYFEEYIERVQDEDGITMKDMFKGFKADIFMSGGKRKKPILNHIELIFDSTESVIDKDLADCKAQYANQDGTPAKKWENCRTKLRSLDTHELHYVQPPTNHIVIDFDLKNSKGEKDFQKNIKEASKWPPTYAELSKSGSGIHLHYIYTGDPDDLAPKYADDIEVKVFKGNSALRRKLTKCNSLPVNTISSGLPLREKGEKLIDEKVVQNEKKLKNTIAKALRKEIPPGSTKTSIDFIKKILDEAYEEGVVYDVSDMYQSVFKFANNSTHQAPYCIKQLKLMKWKSEDDGDIVDDTDAPLVFYDIEVFPNLFLVNWKVAGEGNTVCRMINPSPKDIGELMKMKLVGFNCRRYDNHILYARYLGRPIEALYDMSQKIISGSNSVFIREAYKVSYTDVYDFCSKKQSLKKWETELGIHHQELGLPWDQPVPEELWETVAEYCDNDVIATEAVFNSRQADFTARQILAEVAGMTVNDTTNTLTTKIIFGDERNPQAQFNYRFMGNTDQALTYNADYDPDYTVFDAYGRPVFPGYEFENATSTYRGEEVGEGGYVYAEPGIYTNIALLDIASMHPSSIVAEELFGPEYTARFKEILDTRILIKHKEFDKAKKMLGGKLEKYLTDEKAAKDLAQALKIAINSVYGLTAARFENPFRDSRNIDNIVAKRGALFMVNLKHEVQKRGFTVAHIKTDSIKIPNATPEIISFVTEYGKLYGYNFEHEATYDRMCLVNDAVYIAKYDSGEWTATGTQFQIPYVFKTLFSHETIEFEDLCETKEVKQGVLYLDLNEDLPDVTAEEERYKSLDKKYREGKLSDTTWDAQAKPLREEIAKGHNYQFIGRVGSFCPMKKGFGGGILYREKDGKYYAAAGTKGYRWLEAENVVKEMDKYDQAIDETYYKQLVADAIESINEYGNFEAFVSDEPYQTLGEIIAVPEGVDEELPFG